mmetsp:Transcript_34544/g.25646  ORF Transcript_34544/g.25646 Transcript_34544/m.25646 type:complete len:216 (-) Transcript_34544:211-858(-)
MECVQAREYIEFLVEDRLEANVAALTWIDSNVFVSLFSLLLAEYFSVLAVFFKLLLEILDLVVVLVKTFAQVLLHLFNLGLFWEQGQQIVNLQHAVLQSFQSQTHIHWPLRFLLFLPSESLAFVEELVLLFLGLVLEEVLGDLHPEFLLHLLVCWLVRIGLRHEQIFALQSQLHRLVVQIQYRIQDYLRLLHLLYLFLEGAFFLFVGGGLLGLTN